MPWWARLSRRRRRRPCGAVHVSPRMVRTACERSRSSSRCHAMGARGSVRARVDRDVRPAHVGPARRGCTGAPRRRCGARRSRRGEARAHRVCARERPWRTRRRTRTARHRARHAARPEPRDARARDRRRRMHRRGRRSARLAWRGRGDRRPRAPRAPPGDGRRRGAPRRACVRDRGLGALSGPVPFGDR